MHVAMPIALMIHARPPTSLPHAPCNPHWQDNYLAFFKRALARATLIRVADVAAEVLSKPSLDCDIILTFHDETSFAQLASKFGIFEEWKVQWGGTRFLAANALCGPLLGSF